MNHDIFPFWRKGTENIISMNSSFLESIIITVKDVKAKATPVAEAFFRRWQVELVSASSLITGGSLHFILQKKERLAPGQRRFDFWGTFPFTGSIAVGNASEDINILQYFTLNMLHMYMLSNKRSCFLISFYFLHRSVFLWVPGRKRTTAPSLWQHL